MIPAHVVVVRSIRIVVVNELFDKLIMEEGKERAWFTIDEKLFIYRERKNMYVEELKSELTDEDRKKFNLLKAENEVEIQKLESKIEHYLIRPTFLLLIANDIDNKVFKIIPTYIETEDEAKYFVNRTIKKLLIDNCVELKDGGYIGIIVRKAFYNRMTDKEEVKSIYEDRDAYITSKEIIVSSDGITVF